MPARFHISYDRNAPDSVLADERVLAVFEFGRSPLQATEPRHVPLALQQLDREPLIEVWRSSAPVESGSRQHLHFARCETMTMGHLALDLREFSDVRAASRIAYETLQAFLRDSPHHCPMKIWNYIPGINEGHGDLEQYRQFCVGRAEALASDPAEQPPMPAATAIGAPSDEPALQLYFLATALPGINVENPRQVNAWHYPRQYGPSSPLFSRGTLMRVNGEREFLISGTASVVGHETHHDNVVDQTRESVANVNSLLGEARRLLGGDTPRLGARGVLRVYIRNAADLEDVRDTLDAAVPGNMPRVHLQGDICRRDLLTEVDGIIA